VVLASILRGMVQARERRIDSRPRGGRARPSYQRGAGFPEGTTGRMIAALAIRTGIAPSVLERERVEYVATMLDLILEAADNG